MKRFKERIFEFMYTYTWLILLSLVITGSSIIVWYMEKQQSSLVESISIKNAELYLGAITEFRSLYTSEVVNNLDDSNISVVHDYQKHEKAIPLPATLSMLLAKRIGMRSSDAKVRLYSPYPFPWRKNESGLQDDFGKSAWQFFQKSSDIAYFSFVTIDERRVLRYAISDRMQADCIGCHNNHEDTPKSGWEIGDVRGILEVTLPIEEFRAQAKSSLMGFVWSIIAISLVGLFTVILLISRLKFNYMQSRDKLNIEIEQHKLAQIEVLEINEDLQQTLKKLRQMQDSLIEQETMAALGGMVAGITHEINTPLAVCITAASILDEQTHRINSSVTAGKITKSQLTSYTNNLIQSGKLITFNLQRASELIQSFKQVAVDQTSHESRTFNVYSYLEAIISSLKPVTKRHVSQVIISCSENLEITSFPGPLSQVITNLITNSVKYGFADKTDGVISIDVKVNTDGLTIRYQDNGIGIAEELHKEIFKPFYTTGRDNGGSGLGLYIIHNIIVNIFHGTVHCKNPEGAGVVFEMILPFNESLNVFDEL